MEKTYRPKRQSKIIKLFLRITNIVNQSVIYQSHHFSYHPVMFYISTSVSILFPWTHLKKCHLPLFTPYRSICEAHVFSKTTFSSGLLYTCDKQSIKLDIIPGICKRKVMLKKQVASTNKFEYIESPWTSIYCKFKVMKVIFLHFTKTCCRKFCKDIQRVLSFSKSLVTLTCRPSNRVGRHPVP